ncbi:MAG: PINc/VapC family ATPase [Candidatus Woesearchaeota archaeon]
MEYETLAPDSTVIVEGILSKMIEEKKLSVGKIIIHETLLALFEKLANEEKAIGYIGLDELKKLRDLLGDKLSTHGKRLSVYESRNLMLQDADAIIRAMAYDENATFATSSKVHSRAASAQGIAVFFVEVPESSEPIKLESFFDETTMSVHLKENVLPYAKKGKPGSWEFVALRKETLSQDEIQDISKEIIETAKNRKDSFIEIERAGSTIVQLSNYRIVITKPPFSDGWEITAVRPVKKLSLQDYKMSELLFNRISEQAEGVLIAGAPGHGKTTFAAALAEFYASKKKIVKTIEAPRDLVLGPEVTQYAISHGDAQEIHDILLLSRPDYTIFDEMRNTSDFRLFADLRLSGIGLAGVVHATKPVDAIQRFIGRTELGVIPQVIDTVIFIKCGEIGKVLSIKMVVKVPYGMTEADLARPIVEVRDFETKKLEYEMYSYGEETVVVPIGEKHSTPARILAKKQIEHEFMRYTTSVEADIVSDNKAVVYVPERDIARIIGPKGKNITEIEQDLGMSIDIQPISSEKMKGKPLKFQAGQRGNYILLSTRKKGAMLDVFVDGNFLLTSTSSKKGEIKINKKTNVGTDLLKALDFNKDIEIRESHS